MILFAADTTRISAPKLVAGTDGCIELQTLSANGTISNFVLELSEGSKQSVVTGLYKTNCLPVNGVLLDHHEGVCNRWLCGGFQRKYLFRRKIICKGASQHIRMRAVVGECAKLWAGHADRAFWFVSASRLAQEKSAGWSAGCGCAPSAKSRSSLAGSLHLLCRKLLRPGAE